MAMNPAIKRQKEEEVKRQAIVREIVIHALNRGVSASDAYNLLTEATQMAYDNWIGTHNAQQRAMFRQLGY